MSVDGTILSAGQVVDDKYQVVRQLGQGGMGAVYEATHLGTNRRVAVKVIVSSALANEPDVVTRFRREAKASGSIDSAHVVQVLDTGVDPRSGNPYMVMEYLSGEDLITLVHRVGPLAPDVVVRIGAQACLGLQRAHEAGVVHRDIKSANMFLARRDGGEVQLKLLDFGIAKVRAEPVPGAGTDHGLTTTGSMLGSPLYMSPEQARGMKTLDGRADLWSLGVALYEALVGETPNHDKVTLGDLLVAICVEPTPPLQSRAPWVSAELARVIEKALEKDPARRWTSAQEMHAALVALAPDGIALRQDMLAPLRPEMRANVAPAPTPVVSSSASDVQLAAGITNPELETSRSAPKKKTSGAAWTLVLLPIALIVTAVGAVGKWKKGEAHATAEAPARATGLVATPAPEPSASPSASATAPPQAALPKIARVTIAAPAGATAEIDGAPAEIHDGAVSVSGAPGSKHEIRVAHASGTQATTITIAEDGTASPDAVTLALAKTGPKSAAKPANAAATAKTRTTTAAATASATGAPGIKTSFE